ncbi:T-lymphocyte activation antigen CD80-like isoform X3 [Dicentrarchus labrax]|uniref:T-lymphocyte activation antigen CD80-like isoform X3 n=1 Tax=Dicentrarchus labrax TaxID=13489 RepID=UPI0021F54AB8|nr:T-lymphocyte activation antigen CD80-like isoform X3 [Dicentrarchus labrax]
MKFILLCLCLLFLTAITLCDEKGPDVIRVEVKEGSDVTLPCSLNINIESQRFDWKKDGQKSVFLYDAGIHYNNGLPGQDEQFKGRVSFFQYELSRGNAAITIRNTRLADRGSYTCAFPRQIFNISLVVAPIISATVGGSVLIPCSLPVPPLILRWFFWQDQFGNILFHWDLSGQTMPIADKYKKRCQVFPTEFSSGNISIRLDNVTVGDDNKTFWAYVRLMDEKNVPKPSEQRCKFTVQVSAPHQHLVLTVNNTANRATCTAHGGYPEPKVSWTGRKKSSTAQLDLQDAETSLQQDPTEKTFSVTSSVSVKEFQSVTCIIFNPRTNQRIKGTAEISASDEEPKSDTSLVVGLGVGVSLSIIIIIIIIFLIVYWDRIYKRGNWNPENPPNANEDLAEGNVPDAQLNVSGQNQSEENSPLRRRNGAENSTDEDAASGGDDAECGKNR